MSGVASPSLSEGSVLRGSSVLFAWNDRQPGSGMKLLSEEIVYRQYAHDMKKHQRKYGNGDETVTSNKKGGKEKRISAAQKPLVAPPPPKLVRPDPTPSFNAFSQCMPAESAELATRCAYRRLSIGPYVELYVTDYREGLLGKTQARWLQDHLENSNAVWKIVLCGVPFGVEVADSVEVETDPSRVPTADVKAASRKGGILKKQSSYDHFPDVPLEEKTSADGILVSEMELETVVTDLSSMVVNEVTGTGTGTGTGPIPSSENVSADTETATHQASVVGESASFTNVAADKLADSLLDTVLVDADSPAAAEKTKKKESVSTLIIYWSDLVHLFFLILSTNLKTIKDTLFYQNML